MLMRYATRVQFVQEIFICHLEKRQKCVVIDTYDVTNTSKVPPFTQ